jgi:hypothetical protein
MASFCWIATLAFGALFLRMGRFATLAIPFAALAWSFELAARGQIGKRLRVFRGRTLPLRPVLGAIAALSCANALAIAFINWRMSDSFDPSVRRELERLARQLPANASVAATWNDAELYAFHAPHSRYLNVYDPVFMAVGDPLRHAVWSHVLAGELPDVPDAIARVLESDYLAFSVGRHPELERRLANDPRAQLLQRGRHALFRMQRTDPHFFTDWTSDSGASASQTRASFIDASPYLRDGCATFQRSEIASLSRTQRLELAGWGPTAFFIDGQQRLPPSAANLARLGEGSGLAIRIEPGTQHWVVKTCAHAGKAGFYLVDRGSN